MECEITTFVSTHNGYPSGEMHRVLHHTTAFQETRIDMADMRGAAEAILASTEHHRRFLFERRRTVVDFDVEG